MNVIFRFLENHLLEPLNKLANKRVIRAIMSAGLATIPFTIVGSLFLIINNLPLIIPPLAGFFENTILRFSAFYSIGNTMAIGSIALFYSLATGYYLTDLYKKEVNDQLNSFTGAILSLYAFLMTIVQVRFADGTAVLVSGQTETSTTYNGVEIGGWITRLGGVGIFIAILTAVLSVQVYKFIVEKNITIKMPEGVPEGVSRSFAALVPAFAIALIMIGINIILAFFDTDLHHMLSKPFSFVKDLTGSWLGLLIIMLLIHVLWAVGVHGTALIKNSFINPILLVALTENMNGANNIFAGDFTNMYIFMGGAGSTLGLVLLMIFAARSDQLKLLGKAALLPGLFNINEPVIFGAPIVYNPYLIIPFITAPLVSATVAFWATKLNLVSKVIAGIPWISPVGIGAFLGTGGDFRAILLALFCLLLSTIIYFPFFKMYDNKLYTEQLQAKAAENTKNK